MMENEDEAAMMDDDDNTHRNGGVFIFVEHYYLGLRRGVNIFVILV